MKTRKSQPLLVLILLVSLAFTGLWPVAAQDVAPTRQVPNPPSIPATVIGTGTAAEFKPGEVLVKFKSHVSIDSINTVLERFGATRLQTLDVVDVQVWQVQEDQELAIVEQLKADPMVEYAEPNYRYYALGTPNDPGFSQQWGLTNVQAPAAWDITTGSASVIIAIIDTGIDSTHPDLAGKIVGGHDFIDGDSNPRDGHGHGTHVAGIAAAVTDNGVGVAGMNWDARIMPVRVLDDTGGGSSTNVVGGIIWAYQHGAKVLNLSLGGSGYSQAMQDAVNAAHAAGSLVVAAMGNCRTYDPDYCPQANPTMYPAAYTNVMAVAATGPADTYAPYSQYGPHCDIAAPGGDMGGYYYDPGGVYSTMPTYPVHLTTPPFYFRLNYDFLEGTSQATPYVAGLAALVWAAKPSLTPDQVQIVIENNAVDLGTQGWDSDYGWGRIDALAAVQAVSLPGTPVLNLIDNPDGDGNYVVDWSDAANATSYSLQEDDNAAFFSPTTAYSGPNSQYSVSGKGPGTWYYRVYASNANGSSPWSAIQSVTVIATPNAPTLNAIDNAGNQDEYVVSWSASANATSYTLQEAGNASFVSPRTRYVGSALQYHVTGQPDGTWYYRVLAFNWAGNSPWSNSQSTMVGSLPLSAPTMEAISNPDGDGNYQVNWSSVDGATSYTLEESADPWFSVPTVVYADTATQFSVSDQPKGTWFYRVRASGPAGRGPWSVAKSAVVITRIYMPYVVTNYVSGSGSSGLPITQGFEEGWIPPSNWTQIINNTSYPWTTWSIDTSKPYAGSYHASCYYDSTPGHQNEILLSPEFRASTARLEFESFGSIYYCRDTYDNCDLDIWLVIGAWGGGDDVKVYTADGDWTGSYTWSLSSVDLTPYLSPAVPVRVGFQYVGLDGDWIGLDAIQITGY
jgi:thermitase